MPGTHRAMDAKESQGLWNNYPGREDLKNLLEHLILFKLVIQIFLGSTLNYLGSWYKKLLKINNQTIPSF